MSIKWFGMDGTVLCWIRPLSIQLKQENKTLWNFFDAFSLPYSVSVGSALGPLIFHNVH